METGMLWFDDDGKRALADKVTRAAEYYQKKYGRSPTMCYVHPTALPSDLESAGGVRLRSASTVLVNHLWLGVGEGSK